MKYKAVVFDIDGTLIPHSKEGRPSKAVTETIKMAADLIHIGIATSRSYPMVIEIFKDLGFSGIAILNSGARIIDIESSKIIKEQIIDINSLESILASLRELNIPFKIQDNGIDIMYDTDYLPYKPLDISTGHISPQLATLAMEYLRNIPNIISHQVQSWEKDKHMIHISHVQATKLHGINEFALRFGLSKDEIIGVGDGYNDFPLLLACGLKVAMGNAVDDLKNIADYIAPSVENDGVVDIINKFVLQDSM